MAIQSTFRLRTGQQPTGRYIVTFREQESVAGLRIVDDKAGSRQWVHAHDFDDHAVNVRQAAQEDGAVFDDLDVCVIRCEKLAADSLRDSAQGDSAILSVEEEHVLHLLGNSDLSTDPDTGQDSHSRSGEAEATEQLAVLTTDGILDTGNATWGIRATGVDRSPYSGRGIRLVILDTGLDLQHPDFEARPNLQQRSFVESESVDDVHGHGTHSAGVAAGLRRPAVAPQYGIAGEAELLIGKVLGDDGVGADLGVLAGINWAVANNAHVVSMSLGADIQSISRAYEEVGQRALARGTLLIAAAGNNAQRANEDFGFVIRPANSRFIMGVGAVDHHLRISPFSSRASSFVGGAVDIVAPGSEIFSSWPEPRLYRSVSGTSMATAFVSGLAALHAEASGTRGEALWTRVISHVRDLSLPPMDGGAGLAQAPQ